MYAMIPARCAAFVLLLAAYASPAPAQVQQDAPAYEPKVFQRGKDVIWVPTERVVVDKMLDLAKVTPADFVMDLGSGDGRMVITAARRGARALGVEYDPELVALSRRNAEKNGVAGRAAFVQADLFETDFSRASVITMFLLPAINLKLRPKLLELKPGTRIVSNTFDMDDWQADATADLGADGGCTLRTWCTALLWIVPAKVSGIYRLPQGELVLMQNYQMLTGSLRANGKMLPVGGRVRGEEITLTVGGREYRGRLKGSQLELR